MPKTEGGVGEVWRAVKVPDSKAASDVIHGGQRHVPSPHQSSLNRALIGAVTKSHQAVVVVQTSIKKKVRFGNSNGSTF